MAQQTEPHVGHAARGQIGRMPRRPNDTSPGFRLWPWLGLSTLLVATVVLATPGLGTRVTTALLVILAGHVAMRSWWHRAAGRRPTTPVIPAVLDTVLTLAVLLAVPALGIPGLFVILLLTARLAALRGFRPAAGVSVLAFVVVAGRSLAFPEMTRDLWILVGMFGATALATAAIIDRVVRDRDAAAGRLQSIDRALVAVSLAVADRPDELVTVLSESTRTLLTGVTDVAVLTGEGVEDDALAVEAVRLGVPRSTADAVHRTALPLQVGVRSAGALVVTTTRPLAEADVRLLTVWADRTAVAVQLDETRRREAQARRELEQAAQRREELMARIAHDLRVPLATVAAAAQTLARQSATLDADQVERVHGMLLRNAERLRRWMDDLFDDATHGLQRPLVLRRHSLRDMVEAALEAGAEGLRQHRVVTVARDVTVMADDDAVSRVLTNLLSNAAKFSPQGTRIVVDSVVRGTDVIVRITDEGPGISTADLKAVFEPWTRRGELDDHTEGAGLGLSTARSLVEQWGGDIWAESPGRRGARLSFTVPIAHTTPDRAPTVAHGG